MKCFVFLVSLSATISSISCKRQQTESQSKSLLDTRMTENVGSGLFRVHCASTPRQKYHFQRGVCYENVLLRHEELSRACEEIEERCERFGVNGPGFERAGTDGDSGRSQEFTPKIETCERLSDSVRERLKNQMGMFNFAVESNFSNPDNFCVGFLGTFSGFLEAKPDIFRILKRGGTLEVAATIEVSEDSTKMEYLRTNNVLKVYYDIGEIGADRLESHIRSQLRTEDLNPCGEIRPLEWCDVTTKIAWRLKKSYDPNRGCGDAANEQMLLEVRERMLQSGKFDSDFSQNPWIWVEYVSGVTGRIEEDPPQRVGGERLTKKRRYRDAVNMRTGAKQSRFFDSWTAVINLSTGGGSNRDRSDDIYPGYEFCYKRN